MPDINRESLREFFRRQEATYKAPDRRPEIKRLRATLNRKNKVDLVDGADVKSLSVRNKLLPIPISRGITTQQKKLWWGAKARAKKRDLFFSIVPADIQIPELCPILKIKLDNGDRRSAASLDRINNKEGYIRNNVWVISKLANIMKSDASASELIAFCNGILYYFKS